MMTFQYNQATGTIDLIEAESAEQINTLHHYFSRKIPNARYDPRVKRGIWDGVISFIDKFHRVEVGLYGELKKFSDECKIPISIQGIENIFDLDINYEQFEQFINEEFKNASIVPREYQKQSAYNILRYRRSISEIATTAGKTLIIYMIQLYLRKCKGVQKFLMVVPSITLIGQGSEDFADFDEQTGNTTTILKIGGGEKKIQKNSNVIIGTYQSLVNMPDDFLSGIDAVCIDEAHQAPAKSIIKILSSIKSNYKFGLSGTLKLGDDARSFTLQQKLGPNINNVTAKFLFDNNYATPVNIKVIVLDCYPDDLKESLYRIRKDKTVDGTRKIQVERKVILASKKRFNFLTSLISKMPKNTLVLFNDVQGGYGQSLRDELKLKSDKIVYYVDGSTDKKIRSFYKEDMEEGENKILIASFGTFKQGISIKNLHNIVFVESYRSEIVVKQSIGRGMRLLEGKDQVNIYDIVDNLSHNRSFNYTMLHMKERINIYKRDSYPFTIKNIKIP